MTTFNHYYKCFGCGRRHDAESDAIRCCAVAQELWECRGCGKVFATETAARQHAETIDNDLMAATQSFASGFGSFATP